MSSRLTALGLPSKSFVGLLGSKPLVSSAVVLLCCVWEPWVYGFTSLFACKLLKGRASIPVKPQTCCGTKCPASGCGRSALCAGPGPGLCVQPVFGRKVSVTCEQLTLRPQVSAFSPYGLCVLFRSAWGWGRKRAQGCHRKGTGLSWRAWVPALAQCLLAV